MKIFFELTSHFAIKVSGADAERYLQGRLTQNIKAIKSAQSLLLTPQGKILAKMSISKEDKSFLFIVDPCEDFLTNLLKFKVADDVVTEKLEHKIYSVLGEFDSTFKKIPAQRYNQVNYDILVPLEDQQKFVAELQAQGYQLGNEEKRTYLRIESLMPEYGNDIDASISATEIPYQDLISFNKGCYAGQEVVEMSTARGKPNKQLLALKAEKEIQEKELFNSEKKVCGFIQSTATIQGQTIAFAYVKTAAAELSEFFTNEQKLSKLNG